MKLLKEIENQKALVDRLQDHLNDNNSILSIECKTTQEQSVRLVRMMEQILDYNQMDITFRIKQQKALLDKMNKDVPMKTIEFEKDSREANININRLIEESEKTERFKNASEGVIGALKDIATKYNLEKQTIEQDDKNELYFELKRLLTVAKKWK